MLQTTVIGYLGSDAEYHNENGKEFSVFRVADTNRWEDASGVKHEETTWVDCILRGKPAVLPYLKKGTQVYAAGSTTLRVYSSAKDRCMKAGLTINVKQVELLGGKPEEIPSILYRQEDNAAVNIRKFYFAEGYYNNPGTTPILLFGKNGSSYNILENGLVKKCDETSQQNADTATAEETKEPKKEAKKGK